MKLTKLFLAVCLVAFLAIFANIKTAYADGYLFISPQRVKLSDKSKVSSLHLVNKADVPKTYEINLVNYSMENGKNLQIVDNMKHSAKDFIRFSPRRVTLGPNEDQYVRVMARAPKDLEEGGYHVHIEFNEVENAHSKATSEGEKVDGDKVKFAVSAAYGVAIPIFVENGKTSANAKILNADYSLKADGKSGELTAKFAREGNTTSYNLMTITYIDKNGESHVAATPARLAIYRETDNIERTFALNLPEGVAFNGGEFKITLSEIGTGDKVELIDETRIPIR
ncbi:MAG: hypothetical protein COV36_01570 [Alphaproteobacteria bacterium CG11_big_fil_rev_8_21_14_0_20_44_7]|nr:MAG: hypothetical protein COV36_01570 [Alphaproteobacteria bacterium CG11_big_fil_rev_8_21_14_0_20_44_7]